MYKSAAEYKCSGCLRCFAPVLFKAHIQTCGKLVSSSDRQVDDRIFIKAVEKTQNKIRFYCSGYGLEWNVNKDLAGFKDLIERLQGQYPNAHALQENIVKRCINTIVSDELSDEDVISIVNKVL